MMWEVPGPAPIHAPSPSCYRHLQVQSTFIGTVVPTNFAEYLFPLGTTDVICSAWDAAGNTGTGIAFTVTVTYTPPADTTPPIVNVPADMSS